MRISSNAEMLEIKGANGAVYPTLAWDGNGLVLFDAGFPGMTGEIVRAVRDAGFSAENITCVILTHQDIDHVGCVKDILRLAPAALVMAHEDEAPYIDGRRTPVKLAAILDNYDSLPAGRREWADRMKPAFEACRVQVGKTLTDGEVLPLCGGIEVIHTPGHTPGHICLLLRESGVLVGGDAVNIADGVLTGPNPQHTYDAELGARSLEKVKKHDFTAVVSYHCGYLKM
ncbi:MAG: MBL fold metallo-hydrolase [Firmicutes bacterium]|nr:MBL fold metallo-hydrolase [Bacillota bacterium]